MSSFETNEAAFEACKNYTILKPRADARIGKIACARYPDGGTQVGIGSSGNLYRLDYDGTGSSSVAEALGCVSCPYPEDRFAFSVTESYDEAGKLVKTTSFVPVVEVAPEQ